MAKCWPHHLTETEVREMTKIPMGFSEFDPFARMSHLKRAEADVVDRFVGRSRGAAQKFVDLTFFTKLITTMTELFSDFCGGSGGVPPRPAREAAYRMKFPDQEDDELHFKIAESSAKSTITRDENPTGSRVKGKELRKLRYRYAVRAFYARKDSAAAQSLKNLTAYVKETRGGR